MGGGFGWLVRVSTPAKSDIAHAVVLYIVHMYIHDKINQKQSWKGARLMVKTGQQR